MLSYQQLKEQLNSHLSRTRTINGWTLINTVHGVERGTTADRYLSDADLTTIIQNTIKRISVFKEQKNGEYMFKSKSIGRSVVLDVNFDVKRFRIITILEKNKDIPKVGTPKIFVESTGYIAIDIE